VERVEREDTRFERTPGGVEVGAGARLPVKQATLQQIFLEPPRDSGMGAPAAELWGGWKHD
jgi:hypothetical protein